MSIPSLFFEKLRSFFWPILPQDRPKFLPMLLMFFLISFNYNILRAVKDTLLITAPSSGAEALPFIKVWVILPMAFLMTFLFTWLSNRYSREKVFYIIITIFISFFLLFISVLYPLRDSLHPYVFTQSLEGILPSGLHGLICLLRHWTFTAFYIMSELWSTIVLSVLFWGFANDVTSIPEAKRFYGILGIGANLATILSGQFVSFLSQNVYFPSFPYGTSAWEQSVLFLNTTVLVFSAIILVLYRFLHRKDSPLSSIRESSEEKVSMSLRETFSFLGKSKYLICIALIVIAYNISINIVEVVWKNQIKLLYPNPSDYNNYMGHILTLIGIFATLISLFSGTMLRKFSWSLSALVTPIIVLVTGISFFAFFFLQDSFLLTIAALAGSTPLALSVSCGSLQNCLSRASKFTLFDATKEMSFIPLSRESRIKGKSVIDGIGSRVGKSGGSILLQALLLSFSTLSACVPVISILFFIIVTLWIFSISSLGKKFNALILPSAPIEEEAKTKPPEEVRV